MIYTQGINENDWGAMMINPQIHLDESQRLETLRALKILDSGPEDRFDRLTRMAMRMFSVPISLVSLVDKDRLWCKSAQGIDVSELPRRDSLCGQAILGDELFLVPDANEDERFKNSPLVVNDPYLRFYAGFPLRVSNGHNMGTLCLIDHKPRNLSLEDQELLKDLASMAEHEIAAVQLSTLDELTNISNRRGFLTLARHSLNMCKRNNQAASLILFDLDHFKPINDQFGHAEGDRALIAFSNILKQEFRDSDVFARIGGDEFVALLNGTGEDRMQEVLLRFSTALETYNIQAARGYDIHCSAGYTVKCPDDQTTLEQMIAHADTQMYRQKSKRH